LSRRRALRVICLAFASSVLLATMLPVGASAAWPAGVAKIAVPTSRVENGDIYGSAAGIAQREYPTWTGVDHVVIASGETAALSDAIVASSLCWAYDAPLLLVSKNSLPAATRDALAAIASANPTMTVHVVGPSANISAGTLGKIRTAAGTASVEQPWLGASRYSLAAFVAQRVRTVAAQSGRVVPPVAFVANGSNPKNLWDAAAVSAVSRNTGIPILLTGSVSVPPSTTSALTAAGNPTVIVVGGTGTVSKTVFTKLRATERWGGTSRYSTAVSVASHARARGYSDVSTFGVSATVRHAVIGAGLVGTRGGVLLYSGTDRLHKTTWSFLAPRAASLSNAFAFGGVSIADAQIAEIQGAGAKPLFESGAPGRYVGKRFRVAGWAGGNTTEVAIYVRGKKVRTIKVKPWGRFNATSVKMPASKARVTAVAYNPDGQGANASRLAKRLKYPSATCIVIDKSDYKLYWVKNNRLVKAYPIAIGRASMETPAPATWKILAKYHTSPGSVYGPRKMRLFRQRGGSYAFTAYGIHGTNQPWVIGTKASHGCIRMYNRDVLKLFPQVPMGTMVYTRQ